MGCRWSIGTRSSARQVLPILDDQFAFRFNATADDAGQIVIEGLPAFETTKANDIAVFLNAFEMHPGPQFPQPPREIFWCETGGFVESQGSVWSCGFNGVGKTAIATGLSRPLDVALDAVHGHIYWAEDGSGSQPSPDCAGEFRWLQSNGAFQRTRPRFQQRPGLGPGFGLTGIFIGPLILRV